MNGQQLKNSILKLAIQGKLVPQDSSDEPASVLLARIREEKQRLVDEKIIKKEKALAPITEEEKPFDIPESWEWARLGEIVAIARGGSPRPIKEYLTESNDGINWIKIGDTDKDGKYINSCKEKIKVEGLNKTRKVYPGDFLLTNSMSFGRPYITNIEGCIHDGWLALSDYDKCYCSDFLFYLLLSPYAKKVFGSKVAGAVVKNLNTDKVAASVFPLPPLAEQHRIVAKIEELLPLVEEYDEAQKNLDKLNDELPEKLKKSVLQQAIMGRLGTQNDKDEPASELLKRIKDEKAKLIKEKKIKKEKVLAPITDDEKPFDIPESWEWVRLGEIASLYIGKTPERGNTAFWSDNDYPWISISDMTEYGHVKTTKECISKKASALCFRRISPMGSLIMSFKLTVGRTSILDIDAFHNEAIVTIERFCDDNNFIRDYLFYLLPLLSNMGDSKDAIKGKTLNSTSLNNLKIPLPPLAEQHRIVAKIEELLTMIERLKLK